MPPSSTPPDHKKASELPLAALLPNRQDGGELEQLADRLVDELGFRAEYLADGLEDLAWSLRRAIEQPPTLAPSELVVDERKGGAVTYRLEHRRCGKPACRCVKGQGHGPYWYAYTRGAHGRLRSHYIGKRFHELDIEDVEPARRPTRRR